MLLFFVGFFFWGGWACFASKISVLVNWGPKLVLNKIKSDILINMYLHFRGTSSECQGLWVDGGGSIFKGRVNSIASMSNLAVGRQADCMRPACPEFDMLEKGSWP